VKIATAKKFKVKRTLLIMHSPFGVELNCRDIEVHQDSVEAREPKAKSLTSL
jgi:hypothetical protein